MTANSQHEQQFELQPQLSGYESLKIGGEKKRKRWLLPVLRSEGKDKWVWRCRVAAVSQRVSTRLGLALVCVLAAADSVVPFSFAFRSSPAASSSQE